MIYSARQKPGSFSDKPLSLGIHELPSSDGPGPPAGTLGRKGHAPRGEVEALLPGSEVEPFDLELATHIISRIEARVPGRIRHLAVCTTENAVVLTGECSTFYTKQVAQHAAMGVLEYEQLINNIDVRTVK